MKKVLYGLVVGIFVLSGAGPILAAGEVTNSETGAESGNEASSFVSVVEKVVNQNSISQHNVVSLGADTGDNSASFNTGDTEEEEDVEVSGGGSVETGVASISVTIENNSNTTVTEVDGCCNGEDDDDDDDGQGGGDLDPEGEEPTPLTPTGDGFGGGELIEEVSLLPAAGLRTVDSFSILVGLPLVLAMIISIAEQKARKRV